MWRRHSPCASQIHAATLPGRGCASSSNRDAPRTCHELSMTDIVDASKRSDIMSRIGGRDTAPEVAVRRIAHRLGFRFRLHRRNLPGTPDIVFPRHQAVVFVNGCFWHRHAGCRYAYEPKSRTQFWTKKFEGNVARDARNHAALRRLGWRVLVIWECETRDPGTVAARLLAHLHRGRPSVEQGRSSDDKLSRPSRPSPS